MQIGPYTINGKAVLAPMAGITDFPFRQICLEMGAAMVTGEMTSSNPALRGTAKSLSRRASLLEQEPRAIQIVGTDPATMASAAEYHVTHGAQIIDINMGCPAKKVCKKLAGSALMRDEKLVEDILDTVVRRVDVPVTLKIRTGWDQRHKNATTIAKIAEQCGVQSLVVHGRTRACKFVGTVEYDTIADVVNTVNIPVIANGDIQSGQDASRVLAYTGAEAVMIGRSARGNPWLFSEINTLLADSKVSCALFNGKSLNFNDANQYTRLIIKHLRMIHCYYSSFCNQPKRQNKPTANAAIINNLPVDHAIRVARKHICWYFEQLKHVVDRGLRDRDLAVSDRLDSIKSSRRLKLYSKIDTARLFFNQLDSKAAQLDYLEQFFGDLLTTGDIAA